MLIAFDDVGECVDAMLRRVGRRVVLAVPLGLGKPVALVDEFWRRALRDPGLDLTIVTRQPGKEIDQLLRQERFAWAVAQGFCPHEQNPMPLAMFNAECFCREWACNALDAMSRPYRIA